MQVGHPERAGVPAARQQGRVDGGQRPAVDVEGLQGHRAVDVHGHRGHQALRHQGADAQQHELGAVDRERRHEQAAAACDRAPDRRGEHVVAAVGRWGRVRAVAVGRLHDDHVGRGRVLPPWHEGVVGTAQVTAEQHPRPVGDEQGTRRPEDVPRRLQRHGDVVGERHVVVQRHPVQQRQGAFDVGRVVERQGGAVPGDARLGGVRGILLLQVGAVAQHDRRQLGRLRGAEHGGVEPTAHQAGEVAAVVEVRVREHHAVEGRGVDREVVPVALAQLTQPLVEPCVDEHPRRGGLDQEAAAGHGAGSPPEGQRGAGHASILVLASRRGQGPAGPRISHATRAAGQGRPGGRRCPDRVSRRCRPTGCHRGCADGCGCASGGRRPRRVRRRRGMPVASCRCATRHRAHPGRRHRAHRDRGHGRRRKTARAGRRPCRSRRGPRAPRHPGPHGSAARGGGGPWCPRGCRGRRRGAARRSRSPAGSGMPRSSALLMSAQRCRSSQSTKVTAMPVLPARPVRPMRCR